jgi:hypothetical protein
MCKSGLQRQCIGRADSSEAVEDPSAEERAQSAHFHAETKTQGKSATEENTPQPLSSGNRSLQHPAMQEASHPPYIPLVPKLDFRILEVKNRAGCSGMLPGEGDTSQQPTAIDCGDMLQREDNTQTES